MSNQVIKFDTVISKRKLIAYIEKLMLNYKAEYLDPGYKAGYSYALEMIKTKVFSDKLDAGVLTIQFKDKK